MKKKRKERREKLSMMMNSRELRRHPEQAQQIKMGGVNMKKIMFRAYLTNGIRKSC